MVISYRLWQCGNLQSSKIHTLFIQIRIYTLRKSITPGIERHAVWQNAFHFHKTLGASKFVVSPVGAVSAGVEAVAAIEKQKARVPICGFGIERRWERKCNDQKIALSSSYQYIIYILGPVRQPLFHGSILRYVRRRKFLVAEKEDHTAKQTSAAYSVSITRHTVGS